MQHNKFFFWILLILSLFFIDMLYAEVLLPPKLNEVILKNEQYQKIKNKKIRNKVFSWSILSVEEIYSYHTVQRGNAIILSKYDTIDLWVQEIQLNKWWKLESILTLSWFDQWNWEPLFEKKILSEVKNSIKNTPFSLINGQFFDPKREITPLSFWIKVDGIIQTAGADNRNESKNILILEKNKAKIIPYSWENFRDAPGYFAMVNLSLETSYYRDDYIGRTYICLKNPNTDNESSTVLVFTAVSISEPRIEKELFRWWCLLHSSSKLDSSWSTRLWVNGQNIYWYSHRGNPDYRKIPHSIAIYDSNI